MKVHTCSQELEGCLLQFASHAVLLCSDIKKQTRWLYRSLLIGFCATWVPIYGSQFKGFSRHWQIFNPCSASFRSGPGHIPIKCSLSRNVFFSQGPRLRSKRYPTMRLSMRIVGLMVASSKAVLLPNVILVLLPTQLLVDLEHAYFLNMLMCLSNQARNILCGSPSQPSK